MTTLAGRVFRSGDVVYRFTQDRLTDVVTATFSGGPVAAGSFVGVRDGRRVDGVFCRLDRSGVSASGDWSCVVDGDGVRVGQDVLVEVPGPPFLRTRVARPVASLAASVAFYEGLGLVVTGGFQDHAGYDGAFLALPGGGELELTSPGQVLPSAPDDLLVLYLATSSDVAAVAAGRPSVGAENPYWRDFGVTLLDPDGYRVVLTAPPGA